MSLFIVNYGRELRMEADIRRKEKAEKAMEFAERMKKIQEEVSKKAQKEMNWQVEKLKRRYKVMLSTKDLVFKEWLAKKLVDWYVGPYIINEVVSTNAVKLWLPTSMRIHLVVNVSQVVWYREQVEGHKIEEAKLVEVDRVEEWEVEKILNKRKIKGVVKYLMWWKIFIVE